MDFFNEIQSKIQEEKKRAQSERIKFLEGILSKASDFFKDEYEIETEYPYVLMVHNWSDDLLYSCEYISLDFFDKDWNEVESFVIWDRYSEIEEHEYSHIEGIPSNSISSEDLIK